MTEMSVIVKLKQGKFLGLKIKASINVRYKFTIF
jgi:hypothetical protein